jgi:hypothetical protein
MLAWPDGVEWFRDNEWKPVGTVPIGATVDVWAARRGIAKCPWLEQHKRFHACTFDGRRWNGLPEGWTVRLWTAAMPDRRKIALTVSASAVGRQSPTGGGWHDEA